MKYVGTYSDPKDIVTKDKLEAVASRVSTNEDNIAMAESDIEGLQTTVGTLQTNVNNVQTALTSKQDTVVGGASTITENNLTGNRALVSNSSGKVAVSNVTSTELGYLDGVTSNVQTQLNKKLESVPVTSVNGATGEVKSTFYVTVTPTGSGYAATADKTAAEVYAAYTAGYAVYAVVKFEEVKAPLELPLVAAAPFFGTFVLGFGALGSLNPTENPQYPTVVYNGTEWMAWLGTLAKKSDIPMELKNPYSLNIKIGDTTTSYDGSAAKTVEIPKGVPSVTSVNNKTGAVQLNATDVGALPGTTIIPSKTSQLTNDSGFITIDDVPDAPVTSVNGKTGVVALNANDVGAVSKTGDTMTGNLTVGSASLQTDGYVIGTFLKTTANIALGSAASKIAVINDGWIHSRTTGQIKSDIGLGNVDNVRQYSDTNPPPYPVTSVNGNTGAVNLTSSDIGAATANDIHTALNRTNAVDVANSNYTTYMARGEALFSYEVTPTVNGCIAWQYE